MPLLLCTGVNDELLLLVDDDFTVRTAMAAALERPGRKIITCSDLESAEILIDTLPIRATIADVRLSGQFGCEGLDLIKYVMERQPGARVVLISGHASQELQSEATARGAVALLQKPFCIEQVEMAIGSGPCDRAVSESQIIDMPNIDVILREQRLFNAFQAIVNTEGEVIGYESLARLENDAPLDNPSLLFRYAERKRRLVDIELACIRSTMRNAGRLPSSARVFINVHPHALALGERFTEPVLSLADRYGLPLSRLVLEITEQAALGRDRETNHSLAVFRERGAAFAFDDVGVAHSHYTDLLRVRPEFLKLSNVFGTNFENDGFRSKIVRNIVSLAEDFGIDIILEGVESEATARAAARIGIRFMQGYWFGRPVDISQIEGTKLQLGVN